MPWYLIHAGNFVDSAGTVKGSGELIEMGEDVAARHFGALEATEPIAVQVTPVEPAPQP